MLDKQAASTALWEEFPELREELAEYEGLLHLHFAALARHTRAAIAAGDLATVRRDFMFADRVLARADEFVANAIHVSYLEHVDFSGEHGRTAEKLLSSRLREGWQAIHAYMQQAADLVRAPAKDEPPRARKRRWAGPPMFLPDENLARRHRTPDPCVVGCSVLRTKQVTHSRMGDET